MQNTSTLWKETLGCVDVANRPNFVPISDVQITYGVGDASARLSASPSANDEDTKSQTSKITNGQTSDFAKYISLEQDIWKLDGDYKAFDELGESPQYMSNSLCDANGEFSTNPKITLSWGATQSISIPGMTIYWSSAFDQYARHFIVSAYNGTSLVDSIEITDNESTTSTIELALANYNRIEIEVIEWSNAQCRARLEAILMGVYYLFDKTNIFSYTHKQSADLGSLELPDNYIYFEISNLNDEWNPSNPQGKAQYLKEMQKISVRYGYRLSSGWEWINGGTFYLTEWETPQNGISAKFTARSVLEKCLDKQVSFSSGTKTLYNLINEALLQADLPTNDDGSNKWVISSTLQSISTTIPSNFNYNVAETIQLAANAGRCVIYIDRDSNIHIEPISSNTTDYLVDTFVSYEYAEYEMDKPISKVIVNKNMATITYENEGTTQEVTNVLIHDNTTAFKVGTWLGNIMNSRKKLNGQFRIDPRVDVLDTISVQNKYATESVRVTELEFNYDGAFSGSYKGRVIS